MAVPAAKVCYDQYGNPVPVAAPTAAVPPAAGYYGPASAVSQTRQVARRTARRTGRREGVREDMWDAID
jgi:hypothetical protein